MANQEHLDILKQGVEIWNQWRKENPSIGVDLREANLACVKSPGSFLQEGHMKKVLMVIAFSLLLAGCGEVVAPAATPTPTLGNGTCNPAPCSQEGTTPAPETPTAIATPQAVTHGRPQ